MADEPRPMLGVGVDPSCEWCHGLGEQDEMDEIEGVVRPCPRCWEDLYGPEDDDG